MTFIKDLCHDMAQDPRILTFSDIGVAAAKGAIAGQKVNSPLAGAVISVSIVAGERAVQISKDLMQELKAHKPPKVRF